jgi:outer membrane protein TolC
MNRAGVLSEYDVLRLQVELGNLEPNLRRAENSVSQRRRELALELGEDPTSQPAVVGTLSTLVLDNTAQNTSENAALLTVGLTAAEVSDRESLVRSAMQMRSDTRQLELVRSLRHTEMRVEQVEYLPRVSLFGNYIINAQQNGSPNFFGTGSQERAYSRLAGISVTVPIFAGLRENARIGQRRDVLRQAETTAELARDRASVEIDALLAEIEESRARVAAQKMAVSQAQRGFDIATLQFREGISSQLERTDAENALRQSEFNYAQAVFDFLAASARLDEATGRVPFIEGSARQ